MLAVVLLTGLLTGTAVAAEPSTGTLTLEQAVSWAKKANPELAAQKALWEAALARPKQAGALENPQISAQRMTEHIETRGGPMEGKISATQKIPFYGKRGLKRKAAKYQAEISGYGLRAKELEIESKAASAFSELYFLTRKILILTDQTEILSRFARSAEKKYSVGKAPQALAFRAQVELAKLRNDLVTAEQEKFTAQAFLNALLDREPRAELGILESPQDPGELPKRETLMERALKDRPELGALAALEGRKKSEKKLALREFFPDFMVGYEITQIGAGTTNTSFDGRDARGWMAGISLPLWLGKNSAQSRQAARELDAAKLSRRDLINWTRFEVENHFVRADTAARLFKLYDTTVLPQARAALNASQRGYESDTLTFQELLDAERELLKFELERERFRADFIMHTAFLNRLTGGTRSQRELESLDH